MRFSFALFVALAVAASGVQAQDCLPDPAAAYDALSDPGVAVLTARVRQVTVEAEPEQACLSLSYSTEAVLVGTAEDRFAVRHCLEGIAAEDLTAALRSAAFDDIGMLPGAEVLVGTVGQEDGSLRYAVPTCMGPLHIRLDGLSAVQREGVLQQILKATPTPPEDHGAD